MVKIDLAIWDSVDSNPIDDALTMTCYWHDLELYKRATEQLENHALQYQIALEWLIMLRGVIRPVNRSNAEINPLWTNLMTSLISGL